MTDFPKLKRPPIVEAILEFRVRGPASIDEKGVEALARKLADDFPEQTSLPPTDIEWGARSPAGAKHAGGDPIGLLLKNADRNEFLQIRRDRFTLNRLAPYSSWDDLLPRVLRTFSKFVDTSGAGSVERASLRYVNEVNLGHESAKLEDFLRLRPTGWPEGAGRQVGFLHQVLAKGSEPDTWLSVVESVEPTLPPAPMVLVLDLEAYCAPASGIAIARLESVLSSLRLLKNRAFFGILTSAALEKHR